MSEEEISDQSSDLDPDADGSKFRVPMDAFIPLALLAISFIVLLAWQVNNASSQRAMYENAIASQQDQVDKAKQVEASVTKLAQDLIVLAQTDGTARAIEQKFIRSGPGDGAPPPQ